MVDVEEGNEDLVLDDVVDDDNAAEDDEEEDGVGRTCMHVLLVVAVVS